MMTKTILMEEESVPGDPASDSMKFETLLALLTAPERGQVMQLINSLLIGGAA